MDSLSLVLHQPLNASRLKSYFFCCWCCCWRWDEIHLLLNSILFYSLQPPSQVWILIIRNWPIFSLLFLFLSLKFPLAELAVSDLGVSLLGSGAMFLNSLTSSEFFLSSGFLQCLAWWRCRIKMHLKGKVRDTSIPFVVVFGFVLKPVKFLSDDARVWCVMNSVELVSWTSSTRAS